MSRPGPTLDSSAAPWLPAWVLAGGLLLWPRPAQAAAFEGGPQWIGAGVALGLFLLVVLIATFVLRRPSQPDMGSGAGVVTPAPAASLPPTPTDFADSRLGRLQEGIGRRRRALQEGQRGFPGDTEVMARFLEGCGRMQRGEAPPVSPERQLPPGTLTRLSRLYDQLLSAKPARARDWPLQRASLSSQIRTTLGQRDTSRFLELLDGLAKRRVDRQLPTTEEASGWSDFLAQFRDTPAAPAPLASGPDAELAVAEDVPTSELSSLFAAQSDPEDAPTVDTDLLFPESAAPAGALNTPDPLFPGSGPDSAEDAPTVDTDVLFPSRSVAEEGAPVDSLFPADPTAEEDAPTVDAPTLFPTSSATEEDDLALPLAEEDAPTVDTENLFPTRKFLGSEEADDPTDDAPTVDTFRLFGARSSGKEPGGASPPARRKRRLAKPTRASFTETDELLDPVEDAPTRDTADLFPKE